MARHAAPLDAYNDDTASTLHEAMLAEALAEITGLAQAWPSSNGTAYDITAGTGTLRKIILG